MDDVRLYVAASSAIKGRPHTRADGGRYPCNDVLRGAVLSGCAREACSRAHSPGEGGRIWPFPTIGLWTGMLLAPPSSISGAPVSY